MVQLTNRGQTVKQWQSGSLTITGNGNSIMDMITASENYPYDGFVYHSINGTYASGDITRDGNDFILNYRFENAGLNFIAVEFKLLNMETNAFEFFTEYGSDTIQFWAISPAMYSGNAIKVPIYTHAPNQRVRMVLEDWQGNHVAELLQYSGSNKQAVFELNEVVHTYLQDLVPLPQLSLDGLVCGVEVFKAFNCECVIGPTEEPFSIDFLAAYGSVQRDTYIQNLYNTYFTISQFYDFRRCSDAPNTKPAYYGIAEMIGFGIGPRATDNECRLEVQGMALSNSALGSSIQVQSVEEGEWTIRTAEVTITDPSMVEYALVLTFGNFSLLPADAFEERALGFRRLKQLPITQHQPTYMVFLNKYGAWENFMFLGELKESHQGRGQNIDLYINEDEPIAQQKYPVARGFERTYTINSGEHDLQVIRWLSKELSMTRHAYVMVAYSNFKKIFIEPSKMAEIRSDQYIASLDISFTTDTDTQLIK